MNRQTRVQELADLAFTKDPIASKSRSAASASCAACSPSRSRSGFSLVRCAYGLPKLRCGRMRRSCDHFGVS